MPARAPDPGAQSILHSSPRGRPRLCLQQRILGAPRRNLRPVTPVEFPSLKADVQGEGQR